MNYFLLILLVFLLILAAKLVEVDMPDGFIYFIQAEESGAIKIGHSQRPDERLYALQIGNHEELVILYTFESSIYLEKDIQAMFEKDRKRGEWFNPSKDIFDFLNDVRKKKIDIKALNNSAKYKRGISTPYLTQLEKKWAEKKFMDQMNSVVPDSPNPFPGNKYDELDFEFPEWFMKIKMES